MAHAVLGHGAVMTRSCARRVRRSRSAGFTLVELGAVVVIVSVLAVLAIVGYRRMITASHGAEARHMISAIRVAQEAYKAETGTYANISPALAVANASSGGCTNATSMYPAVGGAVGAFKTGWGAACGSACNSGMDWNAIPIHVDGPVVYGYSTVAGFAGTGPSGGLTMVGRNGSYTLTFDSAPATDWYVAAACGDPDGNGTMSAYVSSSFSNEIFDSNDGE